MGETRVNLKHLLEDIRDSYPFPVEEAIITELIANALDSRARRIAFSAGGTRNELLVVDDGIGMTEERLEGYHDIAATAKIRGKGIGFAGVGAKLALLVAEAVVTETRKGSFHRATRWHLKNTYRAPWDYFETAGLVKDRGTAVRLRLHSQSSRLLESTYIRQVIERHFYPLLDEQFARFLRPIYQRGVEFVVDDEPVVLRADRNAGEVKRFLVTLGRRGKPVGIGCVTKVEDELAEEQRGIAASTYGKVIKRGWEWLGITPKHPNCLAGIVEVPALAELLITNKADFLKDTTSLQKYYKYRKAIQEAIGPVLRELGEEAPQQERMEESLRPLEREIERVLKDLVPDFPELAPLLGTRGRQESVEGVLPDPNEEPVGVIQPGVGAMTGTEGGSGEGTGVAVAPGFLPGQRIALAPEPTERGRSHEGRLKRPGLMIGFEDDPNREEMGWLLGNNIWVNRQHPAYQRALGAGADTYHVMLTVGCVLSAHLQVEKPPQQFISRFLSLWGRGR